MARIAQIINLRSHSVLFLLMAFNSYALALILSLVAATAQAGSIYKCKQANGSIIYTSAACPDDTVDKEFKGEYRDRGQQSSSYSASEIHLIQNQIKRIDKRKAEERHQRDMRRQRDAVAKARRSEQARKQETPREFKEAKRILDDLPYGSPGDRAKRESMIEHARVLQNIGGLS